MNLITFVIGTNKMIKEIKENHQDVLHDLIAIYGETIIIHFLSESIIYKASRLEEHLKD